MKATTLAYLDSKIRNILTRLPPKTAVKIYSKGRQYFLSKLREEIPDKEYNPPENLSRVLWGIKFRTPIMNAAGMFRNGECYNMVERQGAGAYLGGTGTWNPRKGNKKEGIYLPFIPYPESGAASNWMGLPNDGDRINSKRAEDIKKKAKIPVGWNVSISPDFKGKEKLENLVKGIKLYEKAGVDFIEIDGRCPNTKHEWEEDEELIQIINYVKKEFLDKRERKIPVIYKVSNDMEAEQLPRLMDALFERGYNGINLGNTSKTYGVMARRINPREKKLFEFYTQNFGGGVSGRPLKERSLTLAARAVEYLKLGGPTQEFHVMRTGGIESFDDIKKSEEAGISLNMWYTGYFENFAKNDHDVYRKLFEQS